jgi:hypothetical protein
MRSRWIAPFIALACVVIVQAQQVKPARDPKPPLPAGQQPVSGTGTGVISGTVISAESGNPVRRARVVAVGGWVRVSRSMETDEQGAFRFTDLPAGDFTLTASKGGYVESTFGQKQPGSGRPGTPIHLLDNQQLAGVSLPLSRGAVITGAVYEETGEPAFDQTIELLRWVMTSGERSLEQVATASTDDRGMFRFPALQTGDYLVCTVGTLGSGDYDFNNGTLFKMMKINGAPIDSFNIDAIPRRRLPRQPPDSRPSTFPARPTTRTRSL